MRVHIALFLTLCVLACKKEGSTNPNPEPTAPVLQHFGFTLIDTYWDDPLDAEVKTNYSDEVHLFSNAADLIALSASDDLRARMQHFHDLDMRVLLHLHELFFELAGTDAPSGSDYELRADYQTRWDNFVQTNELVDNQEMLCALYIGEEPTWNGISAAELEAACDAIAASLPDAPIMIVEAYPMIADLVVPQSAHWVGFDRYFISDPQNDILFQNDLSTLRTRLSASDQKIVLILDGHYISWAHGDFGGIDLGDMKQVATSYYDLAREEGDVVALFGYCWPGGFDDPNALGGRQMPDSVKAEYVRIGQAITGKD